MSQLQSIETMTPSRVLLVDDDTELGQALLESLRADEIALTVTQNGRDPRAEGSGPL